MSQQQDIRSTAMKYSVPTNLEAQELEHMHKQTETVVNID